MKKLYFLIISMVINAVSFSQTVNLSEGDSLKVFAINGLNLRIGPSKEDSVIFKLPFGEHLILKQVSYNREVIDNRTGYWIEVETSNSIQGYVFSGYTTKLILPKMKDYSNSSGGCNDHLIFKDWNLDILSGKEIVKQGTNEYKSLDDKSGQIIDWQVYEDGTVIRYIRMYEYTSLVIESSYLEVNDILNFIDLQLYYSDKIGCTKDKYYRTPSFKINDTIWFDKVLESENFFEFKVFKFGNRIICSMYHA